MLNIRNDKLLRKREKLRLLAKENQQLAVQNQQLSEAKLRYESTPHFEIKTLESSLQLQETKIGVIEREIASIHRKYVEGQQKIQHFKEQYKE